MSFRKTLYSRGPSIGSLGDPFHEVLPVTSMWSQLYTLLSISDVTARSSTAPPDRPYASNLASNSLLGRQSNALDRSIRIAATHLCWSSANFQSSTRRRRVIWHPNPLRNAARKGLNILSKKVVSWSWMARSYILDIVGKILTGL